MTVVDARVAVKWFLPEAGEAAASELLSMGVPLLAPALIRVGVAAAISRKVRFDEISLQDGEKAFHLWLQSLLDGVVTVVPDDSDLEMTRANAATPSGQHPPSIAPAVELWAA